MMHSDSFLVVGLACFVIWTICAILVRISTKVKEDPISVIFVGFINIGVLLFVGIAFLNILSYFRFQNHPSNQHFKTNF
ncbi:hypothetical protein M0811_10365 [Anaeramoeba ignava]|uniref:Uncharacterized protein n=1 Tax=Anaeramoeba ignava TaxID=1746090 RepID=A0A9Q0LH08_ANAIG|nr:hypothetical protein M0811_10365 [Anaeramoeba ignava]